jgi:hypothetical protein
VKTKILICESPVALIFKFVITWYVYCIHLPSLVLSLAQSFSVAISAKSWASSYPLPRLSLVCVVFVVVVSSYWQPAPSLKFSAVLVASAPSQLHGPTIACPNSSAVAGTQLEFIRI